MLSISELKEENNRLGRELADACREIVDRSYSYNKLNLVLKSTELAFSKFVFRSNLEMNIEKSELHVKKLVSEVMNTPKQLTFDFGSKERV